MSDAKPVEKKVEAAAQVADAAVALTSPTAAAAVAAKAGVWAWRNPKRWAFLAAGAAVGLGAAGVYEFKHITADPGRAAAQSETPAAAQKKAEEPKKPDGPTLDLSVPDVKIPVADTNDKKPVPAPVAAGDLIIPDIAPPPVGKKDREPEVTAPALPDLRIPDAPKPDATAPALNSPVKPDVKDTKPAAAGADPFKAPVPEPLPADVTNRRDKKKDDTGAVIRIGGTEPMPPVPPVPNPMKKDEPPAIPDIDVKLPPPPSPAGTKKDEPAPVPDVNLKSPAASPSTQKKDDDLPMISAPPTIGPSPMKTIDPPPPIIDSPPVKNPMLADTAPPVRPTTINPPPPPLIGSKPDKKDNYDEDWHTRVGDSYLQISKEYYKTGDYAAALEAYNKERRKPGERIIRVPPTWVLEEQFAHLVGNKADKPEVKTAGNRKFEPVTPPPPPGRERPAPAPATAVGNNEYRVKNEAGEMIREIARKVYGDPNAWRKLWDLNPNLDPTQPIPNGTALRVDR